MRLWLIFLNELRILSRDKRSIILLFIMPALLVLTLSGILTHLYKNQKPQLKILLYSEEKSPIGEQLGTMLRGSQQSVSYLSEIPEDPHKNFDVMIRIPPRFSELLRSDSQREDKVQFVFFKFLDPFQKSFLMNEFVRLLQGEIIREINKEILLQKDQSQGLQLSDPSKLVVEEKAAGARDFPPLNFSLSAWSLFAIFFIVIPFSNSFFRD